jgi:hypothetical protein
MFSAFPHSRVRCLSSIVLVCVFPVAGQEIPLRLPAGAPLQVLIHQRVPIKRVGEPVTAELLEPLFAFDKVVAPAHSQLVGRVERLDPVSRQKRILSIMNGDFTPLRDPQVRFDKLILPDGDTIPFRTVLTPGRGVVTHGASKAAAKKVRSTSLIGKAKQSVKVAWDSQRQELLRQINSPDRWQRLKQAGLERLPYHPQFLPADTRISSELEQAIEFGTETLTAEQTASIGSFPPDTVASAHLVSRLSSASSRIGSEVEAIVSQPSYSPSGQLLLPEGTRLTGTVVRVTPARWLRRGGELRFTLQKVRLPALIDPSQREFQTAAVLAGLDALRSGAVRIDSEGNTRSYEPKSRFLAPALKLFIGAQMLDNDSRSNGQPTSANRTMRVLAGASGFGVLGSIVAQFSHDAASGLGFYGAAWSVYAHVIARGHEVVIDPDTPIQVRFETGR